MEWGRNLSNLRNVLAGLYWNVDDTRRIVVDSGLNTAHIKLNEKPINIWQNILEQAILHKKIKDIIGLARAEYPNVQSLILAEHNNLLSIETPNILENEWKGPSQINQLEKIIGSMSTLKPIHFLEKGTDVSKSVSRIKLADGGLGTGFLINGNLLITNNHVLPSEEAAENCIIQFNYQMTKNGHNAEFKEYKCIPNKGFFTSVSEEAGGNDWTAVRIDGNPNEEWGALKLLETDINLNDEVIIIQHPGGGYKQIALSHNIVVHADDSRIQYLTDTMEGSSGSPVFNLDWEVVGLHHKGGWLKEPNTDKSYFRNQGIRMNLIINELHKLNFY